MNGTVTNNNSIGSLLKDINSINETYPPLSKKAEAEMIAKHRKNRDKLNELLILHNIRLVFNLSSSYKCSCFDYDEMIQAGLHGLTIAASKFKIDNGSKFSTYAAFWIRKYILSQFYNRHNTHINSKAISFNAEYNDDHNTYADIITSSVNEIQYKYVPDCPSTEASKDDITAMYAKLLEYVKKSEAFEPIDRKIFNDYFIKQKTLTSIAQKVGKSVPLIQHRKTKIIKKLKQILKTEYNITQFAEL